MNQAATWMDSYIGLGSNLDEPARQLRTAAEEIGALDGVKATALSPLYGSQPVGPQDQPDYVNAVLRIETCLPAMALLRKLQQIEDRHGRVRNIRWGARTLDLDILLYGNHVITEPDLIVPHVELSRRAFVLYPLADVAPTDFYIPDQGTLSSLLSACSSDGLWKLEP